MGCDSQFDEPVVNQTKKPGDPMWGMPSGSLVKDNGPKVDTLCFPPIQPPKRYEVPAECAQEATKVNVQVDISLHQVLNALEYFAHYYPCDRLFPYQIERIANSAYELVKRLEEYRSRQVDASRCIA